MVSPIPVQQKIGTDRYPQDYVYYAFWRSASAKHGPFRKQPKQETSPRRAIKRVGRWGMLLLQAHKYAQAEKRMFRCVYRARKQDVMLEMT